MLFMLYRKITGKEPRFKGSLNTIEAFQYICIGAVAWPILFSQVDFLITGRASFGDLLGLVIAIGFTVWVSFARSKEWALNFKKKYLVLCLSIFAVVFIFLSVLGNLNATP